MEKNAKSFKSRAIIAFAMSIILFGSYFSRENCLQPSNAGFWILIIGGICLGLSLSFFIFWTKKNTEDNNK